MLNIKTMHAILRELATERPIFHSEDDFKFALAWQIKQHCKKAVIRLEYPVRPATSKVKLSRNQYIDILVTLGKSQFPIELKYKTKQLIIPVGMERFHLRAHGAEPLGAYDFVKDICRIESFASHLDNFKSGYTLWLTNNKFYWSPPQKANVGYVAFSVHHKARISKTMCWGSNYKPGTTKSRESELSLRGTYEIEWKDYSDLDIKPKPGLFKYALTQIERHV